jgi:hypothetical protein
MIDEISTPLIGSPPLIFLSNCSKVIPVSAIAEELPIFLEKAPLVNTIAAAMTEAAMRIFFMPYHPFVKLSEGDSINLR